MTLNSQKKKKIFTDLISALSDLDEKVMLNHFDFISFFETKIKDNFMASVLKNKKHKNHPNNFLKCYFLQAIPIQSLFLLLFLHHKSLFRFLQHPKYEVLT